MAENEERNEEQEERSNGGKPQGQGGGDQSGLSQLLRKEILIPVGASAASAGVAYLINRSSGSISDVVQKVKDSGNDAGDKMASKVADKGADAAKEKMGGGAGGMASGALSKVTGGGGDGEEDENGEGPEGRADPNTRRLPIQRWTDVAAPVETVFESWMDFEEYPEFMHRVLSVERDDEDGNVLKWSEKIWFSTREWEAEITEVVENERVAWKTVSGTQHAGVVSFHRLADNLTRVMVTVDFHPTGMLEKMASGLRFVKRAVQSDLARFKAYVELEVQQDAGEQGGGESEGEQESPRGEQQDEQDGGSSPEAEGGDSDGEEGTDAEREERAARRERRREGAEV